MRGTWRRDSIIGDPGRYVEETLEMGISLHRGFAGEPGRGLIYRNFERWMKGALKVDRLSLRELCKWKPGWGSFTGEPGGFVRKGFRDGHLHRGSAG